MISNARDVLVMVILFGVTIFVHELGHFLLALRCGMVVDTFSIGFGRPLWKRKIRGILFKVGWIPFGGYVALPQLDPSGMATVQGKSDSGKADGDDGHDGSSGDDKKPPARDLPAISPGKRIVVSLAGAAGNILLGIGLAWVIYLSPNEIVGERGAVIGLVDTNSVAHAQGVRMGDEIVGVNGKPVDTWYDYNVECVLAFDERAEVALTLRSKEQERDVTLPLEKGDGGAHVAGIAKALACTIGGVVAGGSAEAAGVQQGDIVRVFDGVTVVGWLQFTGLVDGAAGRRVDMVVERGRELLTLAVEPQQDAETGRALIGVQLGIRPVMPWMMYRRPLDQIRNDAAAIVRILKALVTPREARQAAGALGGPIMILTALWFSIQTSMLNAIGFLRFLNINLAILNLLPFPVLDGGHILFCAWEAVTRRKVHPRFVNVLVNVFAVLLIGVMLWISYRDLRQLVPRFIPGMGGDGGAQEEVVTNAPPGDVEP